MMETHRFSFHIAVKTTLVSLKVGFIWTYASTGQINPSANAVPLPNKLNWTVILVAMAESTTAASSWAANIFLGLSLKLRTEIYPASQIFFSLCKATSLSSSRGILYLKEKFQLLYFFQKIPTAQTFVTNIRQNVTTETAGCEFKTLK